MLGATGVVGRRVAAALARRGTSLALTGRNAVALTELAHALPAATVHIASAGDPAALRRAFAGARVVVNASAPLVETAAPVIAAALAAGAHYVDVGGEQAAMHAVYERCESAARHAGLVALPGAGLDCVVGDLAAAWAAAHLVGANDPGDAVRSERAARLAEDDPLDDVAVSYVFDGLAVSPGTQRALFGAIGVRARAWYRDRWEPMPPGVHRPVSAGPALGHRDAIGYAGGDAFSIPQHIVAHHVATYVSAVRSPGATTALRLALRALQLVPRRAGELLVTTPASDADYAATELGVVVQVRRGDASAHILVRGRDIYRTSAAITAWAAHRLAERAAGPVGMRAPGELFRGEPALREVAVAADLTIERSFA